MLFKLTNEKPIKTYEAIITDEILEKVDDCIAIICSDKLLPELINIKKRELIGGIVVKTFLSQNELHDMYTNINVISQSMKIELVKFKEGENPVEGHSYSIK